MLLLYMESGELNLGEIIQKYLTLPKRIFFHLPVQMIQKCFDEESL